MLNKVAEFLRDEEGATAVEYGLIIGLIAVALVLVLTSIGGTSTTGLMGLFTKVQTAIGNAIAG